MITLMSYRSVPSFARGHVRDVRVRWALEEAGVPYANKLIGAAEQASPEYRAMQPFGQVPAIEEDGLLLFESGAIVLHVGAKSEALLPAEPNARGRAVAWVFAALNSVEIAIQPFAELDFFHKDAAWAKERRPELEKKARRRLDDVANQLGDGDYLEGSFTVGDLMMSHVLRVLEGNAITNDFPTLQAYRARCEVRPAFQKAMRDHLASFVDR
jgi:glutathione S-transferase